MRTITMTQPKRLDLLYYETTGSLVGFEYFLTLNAHLLSSMQAEAGDKVYFESKKQVTTVKKNGLLDG